MLVQISYYFILFEIQGEEFSRSTPHVLKEAVAFLQFFDVIDCIVVAHAPVLLHDLDESAVHISSHIAGITTAGEKIKRREKEGENNNNSKGTENSWNTMF